MSAILEKSRRANPVRQKRVDWTAWRVSEDEVRVQVNNPDIARAFAKVKGVGLAGYSVAGNYIKLFHIKQSVSWVDTWMKNLIRHASACEPKQKATN
jgi:hypothetical protein